MSSRRVPPREQPSWDDLIALWLHGRPQSTQENYRPVAIDFKAWMKGRPISKVQLPDLHRYEKRFAKQKPRTQGRKVATIKSLIAFLHRTGYLPFDIGRAWRTPKVPSELAEKILEPAQIMKMIELEPNQRNKVLLRVLFAAGIRASEAAGLRRIDVQKRGKGGQITVLGKGRKKRSILLSTATYKALESILPKDAEPHTPVFVSYRHDALTRQAISGIVTRAAHRAGIDLAVSAHWLRHSHATAALDKDVPLPVIQQTLGHNSITTTSRYLHVRPNQSSATALGI